MRLIVLFSFLCVSLQALGQQEGREVRGVVQDTSGVVLEGVNVFLISTIDTARVTTDHEGKFVFKGVEALHFRISYSLLGYQIYDERYIMEPSLPNVKEIHVKLKRQPTVLKDVNIYGMLPVLIKDDTIQYNVRAYSVKPGELVEDLMKRFVGVEVNRSGTIKAQGRVITRVKVNGKDFFTGDVLTATRNLPADMVENIQVIDDYGEQSVFTGIKKTEPERIININLKKDRNRGTFGQVTAGGGTDYRYIGSLAVNNFDDAQQISLLGSINNTNASLFSYGDVSGGGAREKSGADLNSMIDMNDGISLTNSIGINYRDAISKSTNMYGSYVFTDRENNMNSFSVIESPYKNNTVSTENLLNSVTQDNSHKLNWNVESKLDSSMYLKVSPTVSYNASSRFANGVGTTRNRKLSTEQHTLSEEKQHSPSLNLESFFNKSFSKPGRNLSFNLMANFNSIDKVDEIHDDRFNTDSTNAGFPLESRERLNQIVSSQRIDDDVRFNVSYIEPITANSFLELNYDFDFSSNRNDRESSDMSVLGIDSVQRDSLSIDYAYKFSANKIGFLYQYNDQRVTYQIGFGFQPTRLSGYTFNRDISTSKESINFVPNARFSYKVNQLSSFSVIYKGQNNQPNFYQIQPVKDNANPQDIVNGNPDLQAEFVNDLSLQYRSFNLTSGNTFFSNLSFKSIKNKIVTTRNMVPNSTVQETGFVNTSGYFDTHAYYLYSLALIDKVLNISVSSSADYSNNISFIHEEKNKGRNLNFMQGLQINYAVDDWMNMDLRSSYSFNQLRNSLPTVINADVNTFSFGLGGKTYLKNWVLSFDVATRINKGYSDFKDTNPTLLNVYVERAFGKNDRAVIRLQGFDLLNQNTGIASEINGGSTYYMKNDRLRRYFLISFNLRLQKFPIKN